MQLMILFKGRQRSARIAGFARRTLGFALDRFADRLRRATLRVRDDNGPRGGVDQLVSLELQLANGPSLHLQELDSSAERAVHRLAHRAVRLVRKAAARRRRGGRR